MDWLPERAGLNVLRRQSAQQFSTVHPIYIFINQHGEYPKNGKCPFCLTYRRQIRDILKDLVYFVAICRLITMYYPVFPPSAAHRRQNGANFLDCYQSSITMKRNQPSGVTCAHAKGVPHSILHVARRPIISSI